MINEVKYAVVREQPMNMCFSQFHDSLELAQKEAERLARKDQATFLIIKVIGYAEVEKIPVKVKVFRGES